MDNEAVHHLLCAGNVGSQDGVQLKMLSRNPANRLSKTYSSHETQVAVWRTIATDRGVSRAPLPRPVGRKDKSVLM